MSRRSWRMSRQRRRQRKKAQNFTFGDKAVTVRGKGRKYRTAKAVVMMHLSPDEADRFLGRGRGW